jgi:hypothetical protein
MGCILATVATVLIMDDSAPGFLAWAILVVLLLSFLYEDKWTFDATAGRVVHRAGLLVGARSTVLEFRAIDRFCIVPLVKGTIPGTEDEKIENAAALKGQCADAGNLRRSRHKKPFLSLEIEDTNGTRYLIDHIPARRAQKVRTAAAQMAALCEKVVSED